MKVFKNIYIIFYVIFALVVSVLVSPEIVRLKMSELEKSGEIPFGPKPSIIVNSYNFDNSHSAFNFGVELGYSKFLTKSDFEKVILESLDPKMQIKLRSHLVEIIQTAQEFQVDPFWIISVMMVESNFNIGAISSKNAHGLMQIQPETAMHLYQIMRKSISQEEVKSQLFKPDHNIEVGVFYLKKLLHNFRLDFNRATIAYNIGPNKLKNLIDLDLYNSNDFEYLDKVENCYKTISKKYIESSKILSSRFFKPLLIHDSIGAEGNSAFITSENLSYNSLQSFYF